MMALQDRRIYITELLLGEQPAGMDHPNWKNCLLFCWPTETEVCLLLKLLVITMANSLNSILLKALYIQKLSFHSYLVNSLLSHFASEGMETGRN